MAPAFKQILKYFFPSSYSCVNLHNQQHVLVMCAVAFYMMENYPLDVGTEFMAGVIQVNILLSRAGGKRSSKQNEWTVGFISVSVSIFQLCGVMVSASEDSTPSIIYHCVLRGLERLLLSEQLSRVDGEALVKLSVDRVNMPSPHRAMAALGLMLTCMYTGKNGVLVKTHLVCLPSVTCVNSPCDLPIAVH